MTMDQHEMTSGVIPLRHASLPGHVKLPRRYEKAAMGSSGIPVRLRKISIQPGYSVLGDSLSDRLTDLTAAILWIKQELIMLRQHDILLKRQFFDIQHSIQTLQKPKKPPPPPSITITPTTDSTPPHPSSLTSPLLLPPQCPTLLLNGIPLEEEEEEGERARVTTRTMPTCNNSDVNSNLLKVVDIVENRQDFLLGTFVVRPSSSVTLLNEDSEDDEGCEGMDTFCEDLFFRPRTSSMRTSRDMAALARRRGSKELI
ncbi:hypothetical protein ACOMHN_032508 [Nucella lapillus]